MTETASTADRRLCATIVVSRLNSLTLTIQPRLSIQHDHIPSRSHDVHHDNPPSTQQRIVVIASLIAEPSLSLAWSHRPLTSLVSSIASSLAVRRPLCFELTYSLPAQPTQISAVMPAGPSSRSTKTVSTPSAASSASKATTLSSHATTSSTTQRQQQQQKQQEESKEQLTSYNQPTSTASPSHHSSSPSSRLTSASSPSLSASYITKTPLLVERAVIHDALVRHSLHADLSTKYDAAMLGPPDTIDVLSATTLLLSFKNLVLIDHLSALTKLTKLQLDNNHITKIQNLDALGQSDVVGLVVQSDQPY